MAELPFEKFVDEINDDSERGRKLVTTLMVATLLTSIALINSLSPDVNWLKSRLVAEQNAYPFVVFDEEDCDSIYLRSNQQIVANSFTQEQFLTVCNAELHISDFPQDITVGHNYKLKFPKYMLTLPPAEALEADTSRDNVIAGKPKVKQKKERPITYQISYSASCDAEIKSVLTYLGAGRNYTSRRELDRRLYALQSDILETTGLIKIPILGLSFDVNLLCIFSALTFAILYYLLFHARMRERKNLKLVFTLGESEDSRSITRLYQYLTMQQVLTIPPSIDEVLPAIGHELTEQKEASHKRRRYRVIIGQVPIFLPIFIWIFCFFYDIYTTNFGYSINKQLTYYHFFVSGTFGCLCLYLFFRCFTEYRKIDALWEYQAENVKKKQEDTIKNTQ